jgi:hypothetical protein
VVSSCSLLARALIQFKVRVGHRAVVMWGLCLTQVYVLAIVAAMQRGAEPKKESDLIIMVPPYDPAEIFSPSYGHDEPEVARESGTFPSLRCVAGARTHADSALQATSIRVCVLEGQH